jgi:hypothetical protein
VLGAGLAVTPPRYPLGGSATCASVHGAPVRSPWLISGLNEVNGFE